MTWSHPTFGHLLKVLIGAITEHQGYTKDATRDLLGEDAKRSGSAIEEWAQIGRIPDDLDVLETWATRGVREGLLGKEWCRRFLTNGRHPETEQVLRRLFVDDQPDPPPINKWNNLRDAPFTHFIMRDKAYTDIMEGLQSRSSTVVLTSLGGMGKTSLAYEVARRCYAGSHEAPAFASVVWVSDKPVFGRTRLTDVLNVIAFTLGYPALAQEAYDVKRHRIHSLLQHHMVLLVLDNAETIEDLDLLTWIVRIPEPSKALVTTRMFHSAFRKGGWYVELQAMEAAEAHALIIDQVRAKKLRVPLEDTQLLDEMIAITGGNPLAIVTTLGLLHARPGQRQTVLHDLQQGILRGDHNGEELDLFQNLFEHSWSLLEEIPRTLLYALTLFPSDASRAALMYLTDSPDDRTFDPTITRLEDLGLVQVRDHDTPAVHTLRYDMHALVRWFVQRQLTQHPHVQDQLRERWITWYHNLVAPIGYCWDAPEKLQQLNFEQDNIFGVTQWVFKQRRFAETLALAKGVDYYYYVRGHWDKKVQINQWRVSAAHRLADQNEKAVALAFLSVILVRTNRVRQARSLQSLLTACTRDATLPRHAVVSCRHAQAVYALYTDDLDAARAAWDQNIQELPPHLEDQELHLIRLNSQHWKAVCFLEQAKQADDPATAEQLLTTAETLFQDALHDARNLRVPRSILFNQLHLLEIKMQRNYFDTIAETLDTSLQAVERFNDHYRHGRLHYLRGMLALKEGDLAADQTNEQATQEHYHRASGEIRQAIDTFEQGGMQYMLTQARQLQAQIAQRLDQDGQMP